MILTFSSVSIFRLVLFVIFRSICCDGTAPNQLVNRSQIRSPFHLETNRIPDDPFGTARNDGRRPGLLNFRSTRRQDTIA
jgi:hypothetical protein